MVKKKITGAAFSAKISDINLSSLIVLSGKDACKLGLLGKAGKGTRSKYELGKILVDL